MKLSTPSFRGMAPRITPRGLPDSGSQEAINARLLTGDLEAWKRPLLIQALANAGMVRSIFLLNDVWLSYESEVEFARGTILGDTTFRTYITGLDAPRFTNYAMATGGPQPYQFQTRLLGVPGPDTAPTLEVGVDSTATTFAIDIVDQGDELESSWATSPVVAVPFYATSVTENATEGNPAAPSYQIEWDVRGNNGAYFYRNFGLGNAAVVRYRARYKSRGAAGYREAQFVVASNTLGAGPRVCLRTLSSLSFSIGQSSGWESDISPLVETTLPSWTSDTWYQIDITVATNADNSQTVTAAVYEDDGTTLLAELTVTNFWSTGEYCGQLVKMSADIVNGTGYTFFDDIRVQASGSSGYTPVNLATSYVYTHINDLAQESAPSPASETIQRPDGVMVTVTTPTIVPTGVGDDYGIAYKRIYRSVTGTLGSDFRFVAEIALGTAVYVDTLDDSQLGEVLESTDWDLPPSDLRYILALPNGIMVGASGNQLCFSAQNRPHAWPVSYRLPTDTDITGLGNVDTSVVIGTQSFVYTASGNDPGNYSMSKPGAPHACVSARSFAYLLGIGVVFAGPDGLMAVNGPTDVVNLTEKIFTREQWRALQPETIIGIAHDDIYFFFYDGGEGTGQSGGYALDMKPNGFGLVELGMHAGALASDYERDALMMVLDDYTEPQGALLPAETGADLNADGRTIYEWNAGTDLMRYSWRGKLWLLPHDGALQFVRVRAQDYNDLEIEFVADGLVLLNRVVTSNRAFRLPVRAQYNEISWTAIGTSRVQSVELVDDVMELA